MTSLSAQISAARTGTGKRLWLPVSLLLFVLLLSTLLASRCLMAYDDMATYWPAHLATIGQTLSFYAKGLDTPSPLPALVLHISMQTIGDGDFRNRLVFVLFMLGTCALLYRFTVRRYAPLYAGVALLFPAALWAFIYGTELRAYIFVLFFSALMLFCWQCLAENRFRALALAGLWLAFAGAVLSHVFALFLFIPFALAEGSRNWLNQRIDKWVWAVLFTAPFSLALLLHSMQLAHQYYGRDFWSKPQLSQLGEAYTHLLGSSGEALFALAILVLFLFLRIGRNRSSFRPAPLSRRGFSVPEWILVVALLAYPVYAFLGSLLVGVFVFRYAIPVVLGLDLAFVGLLAWGSYHSHKIAAGMLALMALLALGKQHWPISRALHGFRPNLVRQYQAQPWIRYACNSGLPVLTGSIGYSIWQHYVPACLQTRLYFAPNPLEVRPDTGEANMLLFSRMVPLHVVSFPDFVRTHQKFLVLDAPWLNNYVHNRAAGYTYQIASPKKFLSVFNDEDGLRSVELHFETVQRN